MAASRHDWLPIPPLLRLLQHFFETQQEEVFLVGGAVRDLLLTRQIRDLDFATSGNAIELAFRAGDYLGFPAYVLDDDRDTGRVVNPRDGSTIDFASIRHGSLADDLSQRDFTINAMALPVQDIDPDALIDPLEGTSDLEINVIRITHRHAIESDPVRALRAVRFAQELSFEISSETVGAILASCRAVADVSCERIRDELLRILAAPSPDQGLRQLNDLGLLRYILPEIAALAGKSPDPSSAGDPFEQVAARLRRLWEMNDCLYFDATARDQALEVLRERLDDLRPDLESYFSRKIDGGIRGWNILHLGALYFNGVAVLDRREIEHPAAAASGRNISPESVAMRLRSLRMSNQAIALVRDITALRTGFSRVAAIETISKRDIYRYFKDSRDSGIDIVWLTLADLLTFSENGFWEAAFAEYFSAAALLFESYFRYHQTLILPKPLIDGNTLIREINADPGPEIGHLLALIEEAQAAGEVTSREGAVAFARKHQRTSG